jgi:nicotinate-nucleotide adenylyltransferase
MRIGIFGGTFDPFHIGHAGILEAASESMLFDKIYVIPSSNPPHKNNNAISMASYRFKITKIALESCEFDIPVILNDIELNYDGPSYTLETVRRIRESESEHADIAIVCGSDILFDIDKWYKPDILMKEVELFVAKRPGYDDTGLNEKVNYLRTEYDAKVRFFDADYIDISSLQIRTMISEGSNEESKYLMPDVYKWINHNKIYNEGNLFSNLSDETIFSINKYERRLREYLTEERLVHSLNTMREAIKLALMYDIDVNKAAIAGILHDCAKFDTVRKEIDKIIQEETDESSSKVNEVPESDLFHKPEVLSKPGVLSKKDSDILTTHKEDSDDDSKPDKETSRYFDFDIECVPYKILHAYLGKTIAAKIYGIQDEDILNAIYYHTTSRYNCSNLEKIIFIADKIEAARDFPRIDEIRKIAYNDMNKGHYECLKDIIKALKNKNVEVHSDTLSAYEQHK